MGLIPAMSTQIDELRKSQEAMHQSLQTQKAAPPVRASQVPVSHAVAGVSNFAKMMGPPPRTKALISTPAVTPGVVSGLDAKMGVQEVGEESSPIATADPLARAMLEQSKALMTLVANMQHGGDPLLDGQASSSSGSLGTRGSAAEKSSKRSCR